MISNLAIRTGQSALAMPKPLTKTQDECAVANENLSQIITRAQAKELGLKKYFTGIVCKNGHLSKRVTSCANCIDCEKQWSRDNPEKTKGKYRKWRNKNRKHCNEIHKIWYKKNPEKASAQFKRANQKAFAKHPDKVRQWKKNWKLKNPDMVRSHTLNRIAKIRGAKGKHTAQDVKNLLQKQNFICAACPTNVSKTYHVDHMMPLSKGGANSVDNLQILCPLCNTRKANKTMEEWKRYA